VAVLTTGARRRGPRPDLTLWERRRARVLEFLEAGPARPDRLCALTGYSYAVMYRVLCELRAVGEIILTGKSQDRRAALPQPTRARTADTVTVDDVLWCLGRARVATAHEIAGRLGVEVGDVRPILAHLQQAGLVGRTSDTYTLQGLDR